MQEKTVVRNLQILRAIIHNVRVTGGDEAKFQNDLVSFHTVLPAAALLSSHNNDVVREALGLLAALLEDGNKAAQASFLMHFASRDDAFFNDISQRIKNSMESIMEVSSSV